MNEVRTVYLTPPVDFLNRKIKSLKRLCTAEKNWRQYIARKYLGMEDEQPYTPMWNELQEALKEVEAYELERVEG